MGALCAALPRRVRKVEMRRTLVIGYGNVYREDDGVAFDVISAVRQRLSQEALDIEETGLEQLIRTTDTGTDAVVCSVFVPQLAPDLLEAAADFDRLVFVDAHVRPDAVDLECSAVTAEYEASAFTHHMMPSMFLALLQSLYHQEPGGFIVSIRGRSFDFRRGLSPATQALVEPAAEQVLEISARHNTRATDAADRLLPASTHESGKR